MNTCHDCEAVFGEEDCPLCGSPAHTPTSIFGMAGYKHLFVNRSTEKILVKPGKEHLDLVLSNPKLFGVDETFVEKWNKKKEERDVEFDLIPSTVKAAINKKWLRVSYSIAQRTIHFSPVGKATTADLKIAQNFLFDNIKKMKPSRVFLEGDKSPYYNSKLNDFLEARSLRDLLNVTGIVTALDRRTAVRLVNAVLAALGFETIGGMGGWFVSRKTAKDYNVRPGTHEQWSRKNHDKLGITRDEAVTWMEDKTSYQKLFKDWMRVDRYGSNLTFMFTAPVSKKDLYSMQDFAADHRVKTVVVEPSAGLPWGGGNKAYSVPWKDFIGLERPGDLRGMEASVGDKS